MTKLEVAIISILVVALSFAMIAMAYRLPAGV